MEAGVLAETQRLINFGMPKACGYWRVVKGLFLFRGVEDVRSIFACYIAICVDGWGGCSMKAALLVEEF